MPVAVAPLVGFSLGALFAWAAREELSRSSGRVDSQPLVVAALFSLLVFAPACGYFAASFPDWSFAYFVDAGSRPAAVDLALVLVNAASVPFGLVALRKSAAARRAAPVTRGALVPSALALGLILATLPRLRVFATHAQYHGDFGTQPITGSPLGWALIWALAVLAFATLWTVRVLGRLGEPPDAN
jgi:hypothetical protein